MYLLDTHILIWWVSDSPLPKRVKKALSSANSNAPLLVSDVSCWEIAWLVRKGRLEFSMPLRDWLEAAVAAPLVRLEAVTPAVAVEAINLPESVPSDPADRLIVATARVYGAKLVTMDERIISSKVVSTIS